MKLTKRQNTLTVIVLAAVLVITILDLINPLLVRRELDGAAREAASSAARAYLSTDSTAEAAEAARLVTDRRRVVLTAFQVLNGGRIRVSVGDDAPSYYLRRLPPLRPYYTVQRSAVAAPRAGPPSATSPSTSTTTSTP